MDCSTIGSLLSSHTSHEFIFLYSIDNNRILIKISNMNQFIYTNKEVIFNFPFSMSCIEANKQETNTTHSHYSYNFEIETKQQEQQE